MSGRSKHKRERETRATSLPQQVDRQQEEGSQAELPAAASAAPLGSADEAWLRFSAWRAETDDRKQDDRNRATWSQLFRDLDRRGRSANRLVLVASLSALLVALTSIVVVILGRSMAAQDVQDLRSRMSMSETASALPTTSLPASTAAVASSRLDLDYSPLSETGTFVVVVRTNPPMSGQQLRAQLLPANSGEILAPLSTTDDFGATMLEVRARADFDGLMRVRVQRASDAISQTASILVRRPPKPVAAPSATVTAMSTGQQTAGIDSDGDGIPDVDETALSTSLVLTDTDGDGLSDWLEREIGSNPITADALSTTGSDNNGQVLGFLRVEPSDDDATKVATVPAGLRLVKLGSALSGQNPRQKVAILMWIDAKDQQKVVGAKPSWSGVIVYANQSATAPVVGFKAEVAMDANKVRWDRVQVNGRLLVAISGYYPASFIK